MPKNKDFSQRIEILDECLRNRLKRWTLQNLIDKVNERLVERGKAASRRTIQDDLKYLLEEINAPIIRQRDGAATYFSYSDSDFSIKNLPVKKEELDRLRDAANILRQISGLPILDEVDEIINKLEHTISIGEHRNPHIIQFENHTKAEGTGYIDTIFTAIKEQLALRITYQSFKADVPTEFVFFSYLLKEYRNRWFVVGKTQQDNSISILALDRIAKIRNSGVPYVVNNFFDAATYYNDVIGVTIPNGKHPEEIEVLVTASQSPYIRTKPIHHSQQIIRTYTNGNILIRLLLINNYELRAVLMSYGCDIEVLKPIELRNEIRMIFEKGGILYEQSKPKQK